MFNKVLYGIITLILVVVIYITSLLGIIYERQAVVLEQIIDESIESRDFTNYIKYSSLYYTPLSPTVIDTSTDYDISYFRTVEVNRDGDTISQLIVFVMANAEVTMSEIEKNDLDQTRLELYVNDVKLYSTKDDDVYKNFSISYGLKEQSFYYYTYELDSADYEVRMYDFEGNIIENSTVNVPVIDLEDEDVITSSGFLTSYTVDEIEDLLEIQDQFWKIYMYIGIFMVIDIAFAFFIFRKKSQI